jgi:hypothetical protein
MKLTNLTSKLEGDTLTSAPDVHWSSHVAAATLVAGAVLLLVGRKREALVVAGAGAATTLLERPEAAQEIWSQLPTYVRNGQDFLVKAEQLIERVGEQATRIREAFLKQQG